MKRILPTLLFLACSAANAQFVTGQILTAAQLNAAFANVLSTSGGTLTGPLTVQGSTTLANLTVNGTFTVPGGFSPSSLSPQAANTVLANVTGASASPTAATIPSCSTTNSAVKYTSGTGWGCGTTFALTSGTLAQFAATTSAQLAGVVSDESGSGSLLFGTSPTIATPTITGGTISGAPISGSTGAFTTLSASSVVSGTGFSTYLASPPAIGTTAAAAGKFTTLQITSTITPSSTAGIVGTTTNDSANAGSIGEYVTNSTAGTSLTTGAPANATSISLTAGDWDVSGVVTFVPAGTTTTQIEIAGISTTSATIGALGTSYNMPIAGAAGAGNITPPPTPTVRISVASTTTVYLVAEAFFSVSTCTVSGMIRARRVR